MSTNKRFDTVQSISERILGVAPSREVCMDNFAEDVFDSTKMCEYLPKTTAKKLLATLNEYQALDPAIADDVAHAMMEWALSRGATHYTHWFQPLTGGTAEKHDSFLDLENGKAIFTFSGKSLILGEPDASSFPSGGLRCTFEARGYTAWDPTSPAFIKRHANGATLCIPTVFCSYTGEVLDKKTPLLRSGQVLRNSIMRLMHFFGYGDEKVTATLGAEQEYFLLDKKFYLQRPDLVQCGRTLFGAPPAKHQQLEDHYFGSIRPRILAFMTEVERELWALGIPAKTRHNEVAPAQFELAPIFEDVNLAVDHNMLTMEVLRTVAERNGLVCLLHEKPFAGVNGSGKHNNWSVCYGKRNLLDPGKSPEENAVFLTMLSAMLRAVDLHSDLLRATTGFAGNEHRLGANEAPPAIISVFLGTQLTEVIDGIVNGKVSKNKRQDAMRIGVDSIPTLARDATDRNRTSPFAFTGNKFEYRAPGSSQSCAGVITVINTIVAESIDYICDKLAKLTPGKFNEGLHAVLKEIITKHRRIIFNGDNYNSEWRIEAEKRGLLNLDTTEKAISSLLLKKNQDLFEHYGVFSSVELTSRYEVFHEDFERRIRIEADVAQDIANSMVMPAALNEYAKLTSGILPDAKLPGQAFLREHIDKLSQAMEAVDRAVKQLNAIPSTEPQQEINVMRELRQAVDALEQMLPDQDWPLPKYREMLFVY